MSQKPEVQKWLLTPDPCPRGQGGVPGRARLGLRIQRHEEAGSGAVHRVRRRPGNVEQAQVPGLLVHHGQNRVSSLRLRELRAES
jgi:hypothetical protein